ncbi:hypothetical protein C4K04_5695 [Pseudomonas chlororaphis]|uniref:Uncharacterized protein n=1 Tax=Pseudomonas chlororaphis TaxID=587753 RepID=A0A3G7TW41_9PSED|nr:hypothetical protein C4K04_5695 [Pseudomonas chlororaphis]
MYRRLPWGNKIRTGLANASTAGWIFKFKPLLDLPIASWAWSVFCDPMLMNANDAAIHHQIFQVSLLCQRVHDSRPCTLWRT